MAESHCIDKTLAEIKQLAAEQQTASSTLLCKSAGPSSLLPILADAHKRLKRETDRSPAVALRQCEAGCTFCCQTAVVDVTPAEAIAIARHLRDTLNDDQLQVVQSQLADRAERHRRLSSSDRPKARVGCGLLDEDGLCEAYEARPLACAGCFSSSVVECELAYQAAPRVQRTIPVDGHARASVTAVSGGFQRAAVEAGADGNLYELNTAVERALATSDVERRWRAGEDVFKGCVCTDRHSPPRVRVDKPSGPPRPKFLSINDLRESSSPTTTGRRRVAG